ncbi:MAG: hypothetical protein HC888_19275 [Candidatus Competibacteraceae bacterium]|nr:hypothetical protein [Candidatus Competibacteraceae bacterium]
MRPIEPPRVLRARTMRGRIEFKMMPFQRTTSTRATFTIRRLDEYTRQ